MSTQHGAEFGSRLGKTPSATTPNKEARPGSLEKTSSSSSQCGDGGSVSLSVAGTWYDRECIPFARAVTDWSKAEEWRSSGHVMLEVGMLYWQLTYLLRGSLPAEPREHGRDVRANF